MEKRLNIAFYWHMHQPIYKDPFTGEYTMPWALYHGTKDYYDMAAILDEFPQIHQTFNLVPSLIKQLNDYASGHAGDKYISLTSKPASELTMEDKAFILQNFFQANVENMINPLPRYAELLRKRGYSNSEGDVRAALRFFTQEDYLDLQVLFNLAWIDPTHVAGDPMLASLVSKGNGYTEEDKAGLLEKQIEIIKMIIPKYKDLMERGIIEITTTPFYHPIMPLLCDSACALEAMPSAVLPRFMHPEDARAQLKKGIEFYRETFGRAPCGIWPSEGSVSMDVLHIIKEAGIRWTATDEEILARSVKREIYRDAGGNSQSAFLYKPYAINVEGARISMVFRDRVLSDLIGFEYAKSDAGWAANDMIMRLENIHASLENPQDHVVSIILDGENAWETYKNDGRDFLAALYSRLSSNGKLRCVTINEFLSEVSLREPLQWVYPGSWINHNFKIWIGHAEDNAAWDYISEARAALVKHEDAVGDSPDSGKLKEAIKEAWEVLYAAEGSDWFWWYGDDHSSMCDEHFDALFRKHIKKIYSLIGKEPPVSLDIPILSEAKAFKPAHPPTAYIAPTVDGEVSNYFEWLCAGRIEHAYYGNSMHREHQVQGIVSDIAYGFSKDAFFMRFDYPKGSSPLDMEWSFTVNFLHPKEIRVRSDIKGKTSNTSTIAKDAATGLWNESDIKTATASDTVVEFSIPLTDIGCKPGAEMRLFITITSVEKGTERRPLKGFIALDVPPDDFELQNWTV
ncbi:MAG: glycoside hydrolase [Deltaproteobacteria bacterium]|nr:glycoside hydrolase [Deltaproteobacteria bacterium]